ncbi:MAG: hypothetical protein WCK67_02165 [bacterium]
MINRLLIIFILLIFAFSKPAYSEISDKKIQNIFNTGSATGEAYYNLITIYQGSSVNEVKYNKLKFQHAFQSLSIIDLISEDLQLSNQSLCLLKNIRSNLYESLNEEKINYAMLEQTIKLLNQFYNSFNLDIANSYGTDSDWYSDLGFYSSFQLESINTNKSSALLLDGSQKLYEQVPASVPQTSSEMVKSLKSFDKPTLTVDEIQALKNELNYLISYFSNYPNKVADNANIKALKGFWQGIMINPYGQKYNISLNFNDVNNSSLTIEGIASNIPLENIDLLDSYFSFTFKPVGTEKFNVRFNAKINNDMFSGNITNSLNEQGYWVLTKTTDNKPLSSEKINQLSSYINKN